MLCVIDLIVINMREKKDEDDHYDQGPSLLCIIGMIMIDMIIKKIMEMMMIIITIDQGPSLLCMNEVLGQLGEIGEIEQEGTNGKVLFRNRIN